MSSLVVKVSDLKKWVENFHDQDVELFTYGYDEELYPVLIEFVEIRKGVGLVVIKADVSKDSLQTKLHKNL